MESLQQLLNENPNLVNQGVGILDEKLYDTCSYIGRKLLPNENMTLEQFNLISKVILEKCLAQYQPKVEVTRLGKDLCIEKNENLVLSLVGSEYQINLEKYLTLYQPRLGVTRLENGLFIEKDENLVLTLVGNEFDCIGIYDDKTGQTLPLTEEKKKYWQNFKLKCMMSQSKFNLK